CPPVHRRGLPQGGGKLETGHAQRNSRRDVVGVIFANQMRCRAEKKKGCAAPGMRRRTLLHTGYEPAEEERRHGKSEGGGDRMRQHRQASAPSRVCRTSAGGIGSLLRRGGGEGGGLCPTVRG